MKKSRLLGALCAFTLVILANTAQAALVTQLLDLDIGGTLYDVTFHTGVSFNALWDADGNGVFDSAAPTFWGDPTGAQTAAAAIRDALGTTDTTSTAFGGSDSFYIPYEANFGGSLTGFTDTITVYYDLLTSPGSELIQTYNYNDINSLSGYPYVTFEAAVPVPAAMWLFSSGLLGLIGVARKKVRV